MRFISNDFRSREPGCVTQMLHQHDLPTLQKRRKDLRLALLFKVVEGLVPAVPPEEYLTPARDKRRVRAKKFVDCQSTNFVQSFETNNSRCFQNFQSKEDCRKNSFFVRTVRDWNTLDESVVSSKTLETFKSKLQSI